MKIKYFGTCAAEGFPGMFCSCETCEKARKAGGRNIRTRSQALVDGKLLIDFPADTYLHVLNYGLDLRDITSCIITHGHEDHLYERDFFYRVYGFAYYNDESAKKPITVFASGKSGARLRAWMAEQCTDLRDPKAVKTEVIKPFEPFVTDGFKVTPLKADHDITLEPLIYIIEKDSKTLLYSHDSGYYPEETWEYLENNNIHLDFVSLDCTSILDNSSMSHHMGLEGCATVRERLLNKGVADEKTVFCLNHFSHNGRLIYDELVPVAKEMGFEVSYDGAEFEF